MSKLLGIVGSYRKGGIIDQSITALVEEAQNSGIDAEKVYLSDLNIEYINLLPEFRKATRKYESNLYRRSDGHWNENGHHTAARHVYEHIKGMINVPN